MSKSLHFARHVDQDSSFKATVSMMRSRSRCYGIVSHLRSSNFTVVGLVMEDGSVSGLSRRHGRETLDRQACALVLTAAATASKQERRNGVNAIRHLRALR